MKNIQKFTNESMDYNYVELSSSHTYILQLTLARQLALPPVLDLVRPGVPPWVADLAPVSVERLSGIRHYLTTASRLYGARHLCYVIMAYHDLVLAR